MTADAVFGGVKRFGLALLSVAAVQTAVLVWMISDQVMLLRGGSEIVLPTVPVDPRSLFQGDYVILRFDISEVDKSLLGEGAELTAGGPVFVTLARGEDGSWRAAALGTELPDGASADRPVIQGTVTRAESGRVGIDYGIERYFVPEGEGRRLEELVRTGNLAVLVALDGAGRAAIKGVMVDGKLQYEEPLF